MTNFFIGIGSLALLIIGGKFDLANEEISIRIATIAFGAFWLFLIFIISYFHANKVLFEIKRKKQIKTNEQLEKAERKMDNSEIDISLEPISRENGKYASLRVTNNNREKPIFCKATIRKMDYFKQDINNAEAGEWEPRNTEERGPLSWHYGSDNEGFKQVHLNPEFINIVKIPDDMNNLIRTRMLFTFLVEKSYFVGKYRIWIDVICKSNDEVYKTENWLGCIDQDFATEQYKLVITASCPSMISDS